MELATLPLRLYQGLGLRRLVYWLGVQRLLPAYFRDLEAMLPRIPQRPLRQSLPAVTPARGETRYKVGFFLGCAQNVLFADESRATVRVLARNGCQVTTPAEVQCCGMPARGYGRLDLVKEQARHNIAVFERYPLDVIVTDCATCGSTLKEYGALFAGDAGLGGAGGAPSAARCATSASSWARSRSTSRRAAQGARDLSRSVPPAPGAASVEAAAGRC